MLDGYFTKGAHHLNVNVLNRADARGRHGTPRELSAADDPRVGCCVNFTKLSREHQLEVISRSFHERM